MNIPAREPDPQLDGPLWGNFAMAFPFLWELEPVMEALNELERAKNSEMFPKVRKYLDKVKNYATKNHSRKLDKYMSKLERELERAMSECEQMGIRISDA